MTDIVREIEEKKRSSVIVMESGERFWITRSQMAEREAMEVGQEIDTDDDVFPSNQVAAIQSIVHIV